MKSFIAAISAAIRSVFRVAWVTCKRTGRFIMQLIPNPGATPPQPIKQELSLQVANQAQSDPGLPDRVRALATALARGDDPSPEDFKSVPTRIGDWLLAMDRAMLCRVIGAQPGDLQAHLMGNGNLRGVIACDELAIHEYVEAMSRPEPEPDRPSPRRTFQPSFA